MTDTGMPRGLADLPTTEAATNVGTMRVLRSWLQGPARWAGWLIIPLVPLFIFTTVLAYEVLAEPCYNEGYRYFDPERADSGCLQTVSFTMGAVSLAYVLFAALCLASIFAVIGRAKDPSQESGRAARLQGIKDWFIRGDITDEDYQSMRSLIESAADPKSIDVTARRGARLLRAFAFLLLPLTLFWFMFIGIFIDELGFWDEEIAIILNFVIGGLLLVTLFVAALIRASMLSRFSKEHGVALQKKIDAAEEQIMHAARGRTRGTAAPSGASFRAYARR